MAALQTALDSIIQKYPPAVLLIAFITAASLAILVITVSNNLSVSLLGWHSCSSMRPCSPDPTSSTSDQSEYDNLENSSNRKTKKKPKKKVRFRLRESPRLKRQPP
ncbi:hypothetical protein TWF696_005868 [Orbilia brochopaga]|uniref:Uncharacterized protein n=1 Tax=Orbilia brochopaga TaxID=3140254 RepID=A0AAV9UV37_9PEZI